MSSCSIDKWLSGDWHTCVFQPTVDLVGEPTFGLLIGVGLYASLYFAGGGNPTTATVVCILVATIMFPALPSAYAGIAWTVLVVGAAAAVLQIMQKYVLSPATA